MLAFIWNTQICCETNYPRDRKTIWPKIELLAELLSGYEKKYVVLIQVMYLLLRATTNINLFYSIAMKYKLNR